MSTCSRCIILLLLFVSGLSAQTAAKVPEWIKQERFFRACEQGDAETVKELIAKGVSPNSRDRFGQPAILRAVRSSARVDYEKTVAVLRILLNAHANINDTNSYGTSPIFLTRSANLLVSKPHQFLLDAGARTDLKDKYGLTFVQRPDFYDYVKLDRAEVAWRLLIEGDLADLDETIKEIPRNASSATFLMAAAYYGELKIRLLDHLDQSEVDAAGDTYLFYLAGQEDIGFVEVSRIDRKIINVQNKSGETALMRAAKLDNDLLVFRLLRLGADSDIRDAEGKTALLYAAEYDYFNTTLALLTRSDPNLANKDGATPIIVAASAGNRKALLAIVNARVSATRLLAEAQTATNEKENLLKTAKSLMRIDPDRRDRSGKTALMYSAASGDLEAVGALLEIKASVVLKDNSGKSAADYAKVSGNKAIIALLSQRNREN